MFYELLVGVGDCYAPEIFKVNAIHADVDDFVEIHDENPGSCGNSIAEPVTADKTILAKYQISEKDFDIIANDLGLELSFGRCENCI